jgi:hypothetical protein
MRTVQSPPSPPPVIRDEYPALLVLKNGSMHSAAKYAVTGDTLYFVTPLGESLQVSVDLLDRIYPAMKASTATNDAATTSVSPKNK